ncbi:MAG: MFS transporter, partial [Bacillota bacterium]
GEVFTRSGLSLAVLFLCGLLALFLYFGVLSILSDLLEDRANIEGVMLGLVIAIPVFAMALSSFLSGRWLSQQPANVLRLAVVAGLTLAATGLFASGFMRNPLWLVGTIAGMGVGNGIVLPALNSLVTSTAGRGGRGLVTSLYGTARHIGAASGPPALAAAIGLGRQPVFWTLAAVVLGVAVAAFYLIETEQLLDDRAAEHPQHFHAH